MSNKQIKTQLIHIYGNICMAGGDIDKKHNPLTMHHIIRRRDGGKTDIYNGSNVCHLEHSGIHIISDRNNMKARVIQDQIRYWKEFRDELSRLQFHDWLLDEMIRYGFEEKLTKDKLLIYKRSGK